MSNKKTCHLFSKPGGCRFGSRCHYSHDSPMATRSSSPKPKVPDGSTPPGVCRTFWSTGTCRFEFSCRHRHSRPSGVHGQAEGALSARGGSSGAVPTAPAPVELIAPFLNNAGLAKISGPGADVFSSPTNRQLDPQMTQAQLCRFLYDDFRFHNVNQIYSFVSLLNNASSVNKSWTDEDGQLLLTTVASGNGLLRLGDVIRWSAVSTSAGPAQMTLSFQRGFLPILQYYSSDFVVKSTLNHLVNMLYGVLDNNIKHVTTILEDCISDFMRSKSFKDRKELRLQLRASTLSGSGVFVPLLTVFFEYLTRFKHVLATHSSLGPFLDHLGAWIEEWAEDISSSAPSFDEPLTTYEHRSFVIRRLREQTQRVSNIINRERAVLNRSSEERRVRDARNAASRATSRNLNAVDALSHGYEGPGEEREGGPRHDNDFVEIAQIKIAPTNDELVCRIPPYLPANVPNAPHTYAPDSTQRLLDVQFRLLREELTAPLRTSVQLIVGDINSSQPSMTRLHDIRKKCGGRYQHQDRVESVMFNVYTGVRFEGVHCDRFRGIVAEISFDTPPGSARSESASKRASTWEAHSGKRLMQGGLVALVWCQQSSTTVHLGSITSPNKDIVQSARRDRNRITSKIHFFESYVIVKIMEALRIKADVQESLLIESPVMFEAIRPFLEALKREPETLPFKKYLAHPISGHLNDVPIDPPRYSLMPHYRFQLGHLLNNLAEEDELTLRTDDPESVSAVREELKERSRLDPSQVDAVIDTLTREVSLIQGPPGTGKTFVGIELIRVLVQNNVTPILMISFTNHALDHMLGSILDAKITRSVVRLGSRCTDDRVTPYSIEELEKNSNRSRFSHYFRETSQRLKDIEREIQELMDEFVGSKLRSELLDMHLEFQYEEHWDSLNNPCQWVEVLFSLHTNDEEKWHMVNESGKSEEVDSSLFGFWLRGEDLAFLQQPSIKGANRLQADGMQEPNASPPAPETDEHSEEEDSTDSDSDDVYEFQWQERLATATQYFPQDDLVAAAVPQVIPRSLLPVVQVQDAGSGSSHKNRPLTLSDLSDADGFFRQLGESLIPPTPTTNRSVALLLHSSDMWRMSLQERERLAEHWRVEVRESLRDAHKTRFDRLSEEQASLRERQRSGNEEVKLQILRGADIVGCTTTGAARLTSMLKGLCPRIMLVEEAGQVLESHVLGSLVESVEHLILIGDPQQLRPTLNNFSLSMDNIRGRALYRFDMSLMERLSSSGLAMTRLNVQRRMRPEISSLIRNTLYQGLVDHDIVKQYPHVRGMQKDLFFLSHGNREQGGGEDSVSKHNAYEVDMIKDLVLYLLRQGPYSKEGSIVVLCAYLGQLSKVRSALSSEVTVIVDERDEVALGEQEPELDEAMVEQVRVSQRVKIRSVDNYQGEEADIIILSLVRNSGAGGEMCDQPTLETRRRQNIGFLKSENRTNVALSRARHGLYILGNASDLSGQSFMWSTVVDELTGQGALGSQLPIVCHRHPEELRFISRPGDLPRLSPDGGCLKACDFRLPCGHICPFKCHSDDEQHRSVKCDQACHRLCTQGHPCSKPCAVDCGECLYIIRNVQLPCGHTAERIPCWRLKDLSEVFCHAFVTRQLPYCEHTAEVECGVDIDSIACQALCDGTLACCGRPCRSKCSECQEMSRTASEPSDNLDTQPRRIQRMQHKSHPCGKPLHCQHSCSGTCGPEHTVCNVPCKSACRQVCSHSRCPLPCSKACSPCQQRCTWSCSHQTCPVPCGSVCARLPCNIPCKNTLSCGHPCPSVCGEPCHVQTCLICSPEDRLQNIADFIMQRPLHELRPELGTLDELIITLPDCGHAFTVETLDGHCELADYYEKDGHDEWRGLKMPPLGYKKPPTCPTCRSAITSPRYGRVFKRADLDILEINVASELARSLHSATSVFASFDRAAAQHRMKVSTNSLRLDKVNESGMKKRQGARKRLLRMNETNDLPIESGALDPGSSKYHGLSGQAASVWLEIVKPLQRSYDQALKVASARSAHTRAWEASFASLHEQEIQASLQDLSRAPRRPEEYAMQVARMKVGQSKPLADKRFLVEAIWLTIEIRHLLAELAFAWLTLIQMRPDYQSTHGRIWADYILFLFKSSEQDAQMALHIAEQSRSQRQMIRSKIFVFNSKLEIFKFAYQMSRTTGASLDERQKLAKQAKEQRAELQNAVQTEIKQHRRAGEQSLPHDEFSKLFEQPAMMIIDEWNKIETALRTGIFYHPVSNEERKQIIGAFMANFELTHSGHFFTCPNGHPFMIADCGGAMQISRCPECRELIGGSDHSLISTNRRDTDMERILRDQGASQNPYPWGR